MPSEHFMLDVQRQAALEVLQEVFAERVRQHATHGEQNLPDFASDDFVILSKRNALRLARQAFDASEQNGWPVTFEMVLTEEFWEAMNERDPAKLRAELVQVAAVCVQWVECLDRRKAEVSP